MSFTNADREHTIVDSCEDLRVRALVSLVSGRIDSLTFVHNQNPEGTFDMEFFLLNLKDTAIAYFKAGNHTPPANFPDISKWEPNLLNIPAARKAFADAKEHVQVILAIFVSHLANETRHPVDFDLGYAFEAIRSSLGPKVLWDRVIQGDLMNSEEDWYNGWLPWPT